ncbi:MAG: endonuclease Q family protein, partial [Candidatus Curtissbacteria bacterium]|nr:endonuclease Q family protein [Candidatus Curtissbacteria bacterium]
MKFVADLHLHSKYSRAVSGAMTLPNMAKWAKYKGISVLATSDFTHPFWLEQLKNELEDTGNGLFKLKQTAVSGKQSAVSDVSFLLSCEVSSIYSQGGKGRRIHNLFFFPSFDSVDKFIKELLRRRANLRADGRPIVGISARDLANIALLCDDKALIIPAHIWTPWFSVFGSFSGFDSIEECFGDMAQYIYGIETGLSSDPFM